jgi:transposase
VHTDDSPVRLLHPRRTAYAWAYVGDLANPYTVFDLSPDHYHEFPECKP